MVQFVCLCYMFYEETLWVRRNVKWNYRKCDVITKNLIHFSDVIKILIWFGFLTQIGPPIFRIYLIFQSSQQVMIFSNYCLAINRALDCVCNWWIMTFGVSWSFNVHWEVGQVRSMFIVMCIRSSLSFCS